jgi:hypothetical protein
VGGDGVSSEAELGVDGSAFRRAAAALEGEGFDRVAGRLVAPALRKGGNAVRRHVRARLKPHRRTGKLARNVRVETAGAGVRLAVTVRSAGPIAHLVAGGVRPHDEAVVHARAMTIKAPGRAGGVVAFASTVHHPGFAGDPYFEHGARDAAPEIQAIVQGSADDMARELADRIKRS